MARAWIDEALRGEGERERQRRLAHERRQRHTAVIQEKGPSLMRQLVAEIAAVVEEYRDKTRPGRDAVEFEVLPNEGFSVARSGLVHAALECHPAYDAHCVYCNMTRREAGQTEARELVFNLRFLVGDADAVELSHEARVFPTVGEAAEFLVKPVLFPAPEPDP